MAGDQPMKVFAGTPPQNNSHSRRLSSSCPNHPDKPVTHTLLNPGIPHSLSYCEKCSIMLASQGFNVIKISQIMNSRLKHCQDRKTEVEEFVEQLEERIEAVRSRGMLVEEELHSSEEQYGRAMEEVSLFFQEVYTVLEVQKYKAYNALLGMRAKTEQELRAAREALSLELEGLLGMEGDIANNMEAVESVEVEVYETIMDNYRNRLSMSLRVEELEIAPASFPSTLGADIPKQLFSLADKITSSSEQPHFSSRSRSEEEGLSRGSRSRPRNGWTLSSVSNGDGTNVSKVSKASNSMNGINNVNGISNGNGTSNLNGVSNANSTGTGSRLMPHEMALRESLNLTEIRESEEEGLFRRFYALEETIPEQMQSSQESIEGYLAVDSLRPRAESDTLLIC